MTTQEKAKAYDEALERAKNIKSKILQSHLSTESCKAVSEYINEIIPELAESEDEKIRKEIINFLNRLPGDGQLDQEISEIVQTKRLGDWLAYLEKQKESNIDKLRRISTPAEENWFEIQKQWEKEDSADEDENIRKDIIRFLEVEKEDRNSPFFDIAIAYLEKQKEQKPVENDVYPPSLDGAIQLYYRTYGNGKGGFDYLSLPKFQDIVEEWVRDYGQKSAEWSDEDESNLQSCIAKIEIDMQHWGDHGKTMVDGDIKLINWLKALPERIKFLGPQSKQE